MAEHIPLSTEPVLENLGTAVLEDLLGDVDRSDGLAASMLRLGADMETTTSDPAATGGQICLTVNGSLIYGGATYPVWSEIYAGPTDKPLTLRAGPEGLEALILNFPRIRH